MSQMLKANNTWSTELIYSQFLTTEFMRLWVNPVAKSMLPNLWRVVPRWIRYCFSMLPILLRCSSETVRIGWVAILFTDLVNSVNAVLIDSEHAAHWHFLKQLLQHEWTSVLLFVSHDPRYVISLFLKHSLSSKQKFLISPVIPGLLAAMSWPL